MNTPISDFIDEYIKKGYERLHMPGHKGMGSFEEMDITEIEGADSLYNASGIIKMSEENASSLFKCATYYSAEGSSQSIRAMLYLALLWAKENGKGRKILAFRNVHRVFLSAAALLNIDVTWAYGEEEKSYLSCDVSADTLDEMLKKDDFAAVYVTSPDYLGNIMDIEKLSLVCKKHGVLLLSDNAHGAYLKFLEKSLHPIDLGADMAASSAHKTLPVLTGGAYLHIADTMPDFIKDEAKCALALFGSTSPSYLILRSLDMANKYMAEGYKEKLSAFLKEAEKLKGALSEMGFKLIGDEPMKITVSPKSFGYKGTELSCSLIKENIVPEFADPDFLVLMMSIDTDLEKVQKAFAKIEKRAEIFEDMPKVPKPEKAMEINEAAMEISEKLPIDKCKGKILARESVSCPPAVPLIVMGEVVDDCVLSALRYYEKEYLYVVK